MNHFTKVREVGARQILNDEFMKRGRFLEPRTVHRFGQHALVEEPRVHFGVPQKFDVVEFNNRFWALTEDGLYASEYVPAIDDWVPRQVSDNDFFPVKVREVARPA